MAREKIKWTQLGVLFRSDFAPNEMGGTLTVAGREMKIWVKPRMSPRGKPFWVIVCKEADMPEDALPAADEARAAQRSVSEGPAVGSEEGLWETHMALADAYVEPGFVRPPTDKED